jgi:hypothetical protein
MATAAQVSLYLRPNGGFIINGDSYDGIEFIEAEPFSKKEFDDAFAKYDYLIAEENAERKAAKAALLTKLGITEDEAKLLLA